MKLSALIKDIQTRGIHGSIDKTITGIQIDSRKISEGNLFIAIKGTQADGHEYIEKAISMGATAICCEELPATLPPDITFLQVESTEMAVGRLATAFYGYPSTQVRLVGVTGTNGKTTIATLLYQLFRRLGYKVGLLSTVCNYINDEAVPATHTTPEAVSLNALLARMVEANCSYVFMEVSSHAVAQHRIGGLTFAGGVFTNLTRDHLDYHGTFDQYLKAKKAFFDSLPKTAFALTNIDDRNGSVMTQNTSAAVKTYALMTMADYKTKVLEDSFEGMTLTMNGKEIMLPFIGRFNAYNLTAVYATACLLGEDPEQALIALSALHPVSGRFDALRSPRGYTAIVDYAHTPDALDNVLETIQEVLRGRGQVYAVVGAGGNRDKGKRPLMAASALKQSDRVIITSDNPRFEEPQDIINDMLAGVEKGDKQRVLSIVDRKEAIRTACLLAQAGDVVLVAGKGHENYQEIKGIKHHFDDKEVLQEIFQSEQV
ncbi:MAG: UDP-N-acetylmuramoyl-L-alanyl-D-glutamate--2,6-diaminopimelate ligase [Phocaeicola sp.]|nr:UDP-N-acetylmuramoyl-L-alanyl-D-glutamate--2,6-diaminopimelate ligase [Phocaeicola sp.]